MYFCFFKNKFDGIFQIISGISYRTLTEEAPKMIRNATFNTRPIGMQGAKGTCGAIRGGTI